MTDRPFSAKGRTALLQGAHVLFGAGCVAVALPLVFRLGPVETVTNATSVRILGAALVALAVGAFSAAKDPRRHRLMLLMEIVFTALTATSLVYRLLTDDKANDRARLLLPLVVTCLAVLLVAALWSRDDPPAAEE